MEKNKKRNSKNKNKRAAIMWQVIIPLIFLILTAIILFYILGITPLKETVDKEACHQSVVLRSKEILGLSPGQVVGVPLRCKSEDIVISTTEPIEAKRIIANAMYDCWWMLGEGKIDFFSESLMQDYAIAGVGNVKSSCIICATIKFDEKTRKSIKELEMLEYLVKTKIPSTDITYFEYFTDQADVELAAEIEVPKMDTSKDYALNFMSIRGQSFWDLLKRDALTLAGGTGFFATIIPGGGSLVLKGAKLAFKQPIVAVIAAAVVLTSQGIQTASNNAIVAGRCNGDWQGCSNLMLIPFTASDIGKICNNIESIP